MEYVEEFCEFSDLLSPVPASWPATAIFWTIEGIIISMNQRFHMVVSAPDVFIFGPE